MKLKSLSLRKAIALITAIVILSPAVVMAEDDDKTIDMSQLTCAEFDGLGRREKMMSLIWLSGWIAQQRGNFNFTPDRSAISDRKDALEDACENNEEDLVMKVLAP